MNSFLSAITTVLVPWIPLAIPGILLLARPHPEPLLITFSKVIAVSLTTHILALFSAAFLGIPASFIMALLGILTIALLIYWRQRTASPEFLWKILAFFGPLLIIYIFFATPYLLNQNGLPTGDIQKSIFWANEINTTHRLPDYTRAIDHLNRDPVDFYTPGLHALTASLLTLSPQPLITIGLFAIALAAAMTIIMFSYIQHLFPNGRLFLFITAPLFLLSNFRFLRYLREPGYHFQNLAGEVLLFLFLFFSIRTLTADKPDRLNILLIITTLISLIITHQFSAFIAAFTILPLIITALYHYRTTLLNLLHRPLAPLSASIITILGFAVALKLDLHHKIPHIFTTTPHLLPLTPSLPDYPNLLGTTWTFLGLLGLLLLLHQTLKHRKPTHLAFSGLILMLLLLSQGPRLGIDIPPVRALFYIVFPISLLAAFASHKIWLTLSQQSRLSRSLGRTLLLGTIMATTYTGLTNAYATSNNNIRTNSTLTAAENFLIDHLKSTELSKAILVDDYNQRSASWLLLSNKPTFSRLGSDLERLMAEAKQSPQRYQLYLNHLDYEKIFNLASRSEITHLLNKHAISHVTGITNTSQDGFLRNPALYASAQGDQVELFTTNPSHRPLNCSANSLCTSLVKTSTLVNDIGDSEDTFAHLPASLRTTRLSQPQHNETTTYRTTSAPSIPLTFNVGDYVKILWDQDNNQHVDLDLELTLLFSQLPTTSLHLTTPTTQTYSITPNQQVLIAASHLPISPDGFITLTLQNPQQELLHIDLIALGLSPVP